MTDKEMGNDMATTDEDQPIFPLTQPREIRPDDEHIDYEWGFGDD